MNINGFPSPQKAPGGSRGNPRRCGSRLLRLCATQKAPGGSGGLPRLPAPRGFTLVELLVVIGIIGMLAALLTPMMLQSLSRARTAAVKAEIDMLHMALMNYKNEYGSLPPMNMAGLWNGGSVNINHPVFRHLTKVFPRISEPTNGAASPYLYMSQMSPAQAMVFWLQGFFENPQLPLTNGATLSAALTRAGSGSGNRKKLFEFDETRLYAATAYLTAVSSPTITPQTFSSRAAAVAGSFAREYPVYFPKLTEAGVPYVCMTSNAYSVAPSAGPVFQDLEYQAVNTSGVATTAFPYLSSYASPTGSWAECHPNPDTFQIISAGQDGVYGTARASFPDNFPFTSFNSVAIGTISGVLSASVPQHADNITNFATERLKESAQKLLD